MTHGGRGLLRLFFCMLLSFWAHFGFRSILTLYLTKDLEVGDRAAFELLDWHSWITCIGLIAGGLAVDRFMGAWRVVAIGLSLQSVGALLINLPSLQSARAAVVCMAVGAGLSKVALIVILAHEYRANSGHCMSAMFVFLAAWLLGSHAGTFCCACLGETQGFIWGFGAAAAAALIALVLSVRDVRQRIRPRDHDSPADTPLGISWTGAVLCFACWLAVQILADVRLTARTAYSFLFPLETRAHAFIASIESTIQLTMVLACTAAALVLWRLGTAGRTPALHGLVGIGFLLVALSPVPFLAFEPSFNWLIVTESSMAAGEAIICAALITMLVRTLAPGVLATAIGVLFAIPFGTAHLLHAYARELPMEESVERVMYVAVPAAVIGILMLLSRPRDSTTA